MCEARIKAWHWLYCRWYDLRESHPCTAEVCGHLADVDPQRSALLQANLICRQLATAYADHPDYDEEWRP